MGGNALGSGRLESTINVTPLVDVVLVLLIIFMVVIPMALHGYDLAIPQAAASLPVEESSEPVVLAIESSLCPVVEPLGSAGLPPTCRVRIDDEELSIAEVPPRIAQIFAGREPAERVLFLAAQGGLNYEAVMRIVDLAQSAASGLRIGIVPEGEALRDGAAGF